MSDEEHGCSPSRRCSPWSTGVSLAQQGPPASPQNLPLAERIAHTTPEKYRPSPSVHGGPGQLDYMGLFNATSLDTNLYLPASRHHPAEERHRRAFPQPVRRDVRHLRRRSAVHDRRSHVGAEGTSRRADRMGSIARDLQPHRQADPVDEHQRVGEERRVRRVRSERWARRCGAGSDSDVHDDAAGPGAAAARRRAACGQGDRAVPARASAVGVSRAVGVRRSPRARARAARPLRRRIRRSASSTT